MKNIKKGKSNPLIEGDEKRTVLKIIPGSIKQAEKPTPIKNHKYGKKKLL